MLILKLVLCCVRKLFVGRIQTGHMDLLHPQVFGCWWLGCWLVVQICLHQLIYFIDINILQVLCSSLLFLIFHLHVFRLLYQRSLILKLVLVCVRKIFQWSIYKPGILIFFPHRFVGDCGKGDGFCDFAYLHQSIDWLQVNHPKFFKFTVVYISANTRWVIPLQLFCEKSKVFQQKNVCVLLY